MGDKQSRSTFHKRFEQVVAALRTQIVTGELKVGDYLPSELALAEEYKLSKHSVRKGLDLLTKESLIEKVANVGNRVTRPHDETILKIRFGVYRHLFKEFDLEPLLAEFHRQHPHIRVETTGLPYDNFEQSVADISSSSLPDVMTMNNFNFRQFVECGDQLSLFEPLRVNDDVYPFLSRSLQVDGELFLQPFIFSPVILCYNVNHFHEMQLPEPDSSWTWGDLMDVMKQLRNEDGRYGFYFHPLSHNRWPLFMLQSGASFARNAAGSCVSSDQRLIDAIKLSGEILHRDNAFPSYFSEKDEDVEELFLKEKVSVIITSYFGLNHLREASFPFEIAPLPYINIPKTLLLTIGFSINAKSEVKEAAKAFVDFMMTADIQRKVAANSLNIPSLKKVAEQLPENDSNRPKRFYVFREIIPSYGSYSDIGLQIKDLFELRGEMRMYWSGMQSIEQVAARLSGK